MNPKKQKVKHAFISFDWMWLILWTIMNILITVVIYILSPWDSTWAERAIAQASMIMSFVVLAQLIKRG